LLNHRESPEALVFEIDSTGFAGILLTQTTAASCSSTSEIAARRIRNIAAITSAFPSIPASRGQSGSFNHYQPIKALADEIEAETFAGHLFLQTAAAFCASAPKFVGVRVGDVSAVAPAFPPAFT
jgi:hypothetical protein